MAEFGAALAAIALVLGIVLGTVRVSPAQSAQQTPTLERPSPDSEKRSSTLPSTGENLSERLDRTDGVIKPPSGVDPQMHVAPKESGAASTMPVIPPPNQQTVPK